MGVHMVGRGGGGGNGGGRGHIIKIGESGKINLIV